MFKHKELQQQLMDTKLQRITEMMKEVEEKQQKERDLVSARGHGHTHQVSSAQQARRNRGNAPLTQANTG